MSSDNNEIRDLDTEVSPSPDDADESTVTSEDDGVEELEIIDDGPETDTVLNGIDLGQVSFKTNVEYEVVEELIREYIKKHPDLNEGRAVTLFTSESDRAMMFRTLYLFKHNVSAADKDKIKSEFSTVPMTDTYAEYENKVSDALGVVTEDNQSHGFFKVVQEVPSEDKEVEDAVENASDAVLLTRFKERALKEDFPEDLVNRAADKATADTDTYAKFEQLLDSVLDEDTEKEEQDRARDLRLHRAIRSDLQRLRNDPDPVNTLRVAIYNNYNTDAVSPAELCEELKDSPELRLNVYEKPIFSIILQIKKPFVEEGINRCLAKWENNEVVDGVINSYLDCLGVPDEEREANRKDLIDVLPDNIKNQTAPDRWKEFKAVEYITHKNLGDEADATEEVFDDPEAFVEYGAAFENYVEDGVPYDAAARQATEDYYHSKPEEEQMNIFGKLGSFYGKAVKLKYDAADSFDSVVRDSLGDRADDYYAAKEERDARKAEKRAASDARKQQIQQQRDEAKEERRQQRAAEREEDRQYRREQKRLDQEAKAKNRRSDPNYGKPGYSTEPYGKYAYEDPRRTHNTGTHGRSSYDAESESNFAPHLSTLIIAILANLVIGLLTFVFFGGTATAFVAIGLIIATFGFARKQVNEPGSYFMIGGGYCLCVIALIVMI